MKTPILKVELVPRPCWNKNVRSELTDVEWDIVRHLVYARAAGQCEICKTKTKKLHAHEVFDYDIPTKTQTLTAFQGICEACHEVKHYGRTEIIGRGAQARVWLQKVNGWNDIDVSGHLFVVFDIWGQRNKIKKWNLDISYLKDFMESM